MCSEEISDQKLAKAVISWWTKAECQRLATKCDQYTSRRKKNVWKSATWTLPKSAIAKLRRANKSKWAGFKPEDQCIKCREDEE